MIGESLGKLVVADRAGSNKYGTKLWLCRCECGNEKVMVLGGARRTVRRGGVPTCGCINGNHRHGMSKTRLHRIWRLIKNRCLNDKDKTDNYKNYGGRGITICSEWADSFEAFAGWALRNGYSEDRSIDRINNDGNYEPRNCRWATARQQQNNKRDSRYIVWNGEKKTVAEWSRVTGFNYNTILRRHLCGWPIEKTLTLVPKVGRNQVR